MSHRSDGRWERHGALLAGGWIVFLGFPLAEVIRSQAGMGIRATALVVLALFAALYLWGFSRFPLWLAASSGRVRGRLAFLVALVTLTVAFALVWGISAIAMLPFVVAFACFLLPDGLAWASLASGSLVCVVAAWFERGIGPLTIMAILAPVGISGLVTRAIVRNDLARERLEREHLVVAERDRMARDVHDLLGHSLTVINLKTQLAQRLVESDPQRARDELRAIGQITQEALAGVRQTVHSERSGGFPELLARFSRTLEDAGVRVTTQGDPHTVTGVVVLPLEFALREVATNILRHAHAENCRVSIAPHRLVVDDDGGGISRPEGNGLRGMRERLALAGGSLTIGESPLGGARIEVTWR